MTATRRLYWEDPYQRTFEASVMDELQIDDKPAIVLDSTCFYPTSGGQPNDLGALNDVPVLDVIEADDRIVHVLAEPLAQGIVRGEIEWPRRFDYMQQHTGQHILSGAFEAELGASTVSFHLGNVVTTIDVTVPDLSETNVARVVELANRIVFENRPVLAREYGACEIQSLPLRKAPQVHGPVRVVNVEGFDSSACGGTHVRSTGELGCIHVRRWERHHKVTRVEFLCGWRALRDYRARDLICQTLANQFSTGVEDLPDALTRLREAAKSAQRQAEGLRKRLLDLELPRMANEAKQIDGLRVLCRLLQGYDAGNMRYMAQNLVRESGIVVLLAVSEPSPQLCFARSGDVDRDMGKLLREAIAAFGGRGGGQSHIAQGGGVSPHDLERVLAKAREQLGSR